MVHFGGNETSSNESTLTYQKPWNICFWNIGGFSNLFDLDKYQVNCITSNVIICFAETWLLTNEFKVPKYLRDFDIFSTCATKEKSTGRGSGGLITCVKKNIFLSCC